jgi:pyruvate/2-oxoglutarate/acetoin dehydrogenase E1 component
MEAGIGARYARVCVDDTIPFDRRREEKALPNTERIVTAARGLLER